MSLVGTRPPTVDEYEQYELGHRKTFIGELLAENKMSVKVLRSNDT